MFVDCLTYGFNLYAEREKKETELRSKLGIERSDSNGSGDEDERVLLETHLKLRRRHLHLELVPPVISVSILIVVTVLVLKSSIESLILDANRSQDEQGEPNLEIMMAFWWVWFAIDLTRLSRCTDFTLQQHHQRVCRRYERILFCACEALSGVQHRE